MRTARITRNGERVGALIQYHKKSYEFIYDDDWFQDSAKPPVSLTMPKTQKVYQSDHLFPYFFNMLTEGNNRAYQHQYYEIHLQDHFGLLLAIGNFDPIGAIHVISMISEEFDE
ncbi:MAG: HipA N-terminal domain-containing protein [Gracilimonas sp.]|uniref:HipA N-terminal domain-containing protein n=1 Tax=Gracilimonas sp. TaxID=1974203 RepID=UPI001B16F862|nr:HipA N-terminal domain-containing protein [Gracilimonas sp.]MBO6585314.1 HipA N-terminal domain-containing protein [Gracilimonas sp.]MBO6616310.1 HipA N-terminal domain-containing protein [Gracilimonas sp.]